MPNTIRQLLSIGRSSEPMFQDELAAFDPSVEELSLSESLEEESESLLELLELLDLLAFGPLLSFWPGTEVASCSPTIKFSFGDFSPILGC